MMDGGWMFGWALDDVRVFEPTGLDAAMSSLDLPLNVDVPAEVVVGGTVSNVGADTIVSFDITWSDGLENHVQLFEGLILTSGESMAFEHQDAFSMEQSGSAQLTVSVSNVNGVEDDVASNTPWCIPFQRSNMERSMTEESIANTSTTIRETRPAACPLVFVCHGYTGSAQGIMDYSVFNALADEFGFAVCYPQGIDDSYGNAFWNVGYDFQNNETVDDAAFLIHLTEYLQTTNSLDPELVFCTGMSMGLTSVIC